MTTADVLAVEWLLGALLTTLLLVRAAIAYAQHRGMLDRPGQRRSHQQPTPRGGGVGIIVTLLVCIPGIHASSPDKEVTGTVWTLFAALLLVALAGWRDDHKSLPILPRLGMQIVAVVGFCLALVFTGMSFWWVPLLIATGLWSINAHNFMDGIDGLLVQQASFVSLGIAWLAWLNGMPVLALTAGALVAASIGFGYYNLPPARIFMGDVGSAGVGLLIFAFSVELWVSYPASIFPLMILSSAFVVDATLTLLSRVLRGRRWYSPHREHLYQWLVRRGMSHAKVSCSYLAWNLLLLAPLVWLASIHPRWALTATIGVYAISVAAWLLLRRRCVRRSSFKARHVA